MGIQGIPIAITPRIKRIKIGGKVIKIGPTTVPPVTLGGTPEVVLKRLRKAARQKLFPPIEINA